jgi:signal transduction histidine kinase
VTADTDSQTELLNRAIETFNSASATLVQYYAALEEKVKVLTQEVDHKKQLLNSILDSIDVGVIFFDGDGVIRIINSAAEALLNVKAEDVVGGVTFHANIHDDVIAPHNGKPFYAIVSRTDVRNIAGETIGSVLIFKDISRIKQLEHENERNRRLTAMGELVMKIAHEIRNPLGSIELFASLLTNDLRGTEHGDYASRISNSVRCLVNTLDNMLRFSREIKPKLQLQSLNAAVREICDEFKELFSSHKISLALNEDGDYWTEMDKGLLRQAIINLLLNSVHAMPDGGAINVRIGDYGHGNILLSIKDSGCGMAEDVREKIFEPFFSTKDRGTGLGMSITDSIVKAHNGTIDVISEEGKGAEFIIKLPGGIKSE